MLIKFKNSLIDGAKKNVHNDLTCLITQFLLEYLLVKCFCTVFT